MVLFSLEYGTLGETDRPESGKIAREREGRSVGGAMAVDIYRNPGKDGVKQRSQKWLPSWQG